MSSSPSSSSTTTTTMNRITPPPPPPPPTTATEVEATTTTNIHQQQHYQQSSSSTCTETETNNAEHNNNDDDIEKTSKRTEREFSLVRYLSTLSSSSTTTTTTPTIPTTTDWWSNYSNDDEYFIRQLPKIELHVHLDGAFDPDYLWEHCILLQQQNTNEQHQQQQQQQNEQHKNNSRSDTATTTTTSTKIRTRTSATKLKNPKVLNRFPQQFVPPWGGPTLSIRDDVNKCVSSQEYHTLCTCRGQRSLAHMLNCFQYFLPLVSCQLELIEQLSYDFVYRQYEQNVVYTEVRYSPHLLAESLNNNTNNCKATTNTSTGNKENDDTNEDTKNDVAGCGVVVTAEMVIDAVTTGLRRGIHSVQENNNNDNDDGTSTNNNNQNIIIINQILCAITWRPEWANSIVDLAIQYKDNYPCAVVGIDIAAGEEHFDSIVHPTLYQPHYDMAQKAKLYNIPLTLHAGETTTTTSSGSSSVDIDDTNSNNKDNQTTNLSTNVRRAIEEYGAVRIGHGYRSVHDEQLMQLARDKNIHFEICPTSSVETGGWDYDDSMRTGRITKTESTSNDTSTIARSSSSLVSVSSSIKDWKVHPAVILYKTHTIHNISINSDDPAVFHTSLAWQYRIGITKMGFTKLDLVRMNLQSIKAAFGLSEQQQQWLQQIIYQFAIENNIDIVVDASDATIGSRTSHRPMNTIPVPCYNDNTTNNTNKERRSLEEEQQNNNNNNNSNTKKATTIDRHFRDRVYTNGIKM